MSWNYRVTKRRIPSEEGLMDYLTIREVYYNEQGEVDGMTADPIEVSGETVEDLRWILARMLESLDKEWVEDVAVQVNEREAE